MANIKFYTAEKEIGGVVYKAQFNGVGAYLRLVDNCRMPGGAALGGEALATEILRDFIVEPKGLTPDDFPGYEPMEAVVKFGREVAQGMFRDSKNESANPKKA